MNKRLLKKLGKRIEKDYNELINEYKTVEKAIQYAYEIAQYNEIESYIEDLVEYNEYASEKLQEKELLEKVLNSDRNLISVVVQSFRDYNHPERYNFFCWEDLPDIIVYAWEHM